MGREIKFRAKRLDRHEWVYGNLVRIDDDYRIIEQEAHNNMVVDCHIVPETAGQFTGVHDKNGVEIYEGDLCSLFGKGQYRVAYTDTHTCYMIESIGSTTNWCGITVGEIHKEIEVIGNIHEGIKQ